MSTYGDVRTQFIARLNRRDLDTTMADGFLQDAIRRIQRNLRVPAMEKSVTVNVDSTYIANGGIPIPSDYLQMRQMTVNDDFELQKEDVSLVIPRARHEKGLPTVFARRGGTWVLAPFPDSPVTDPNTGLTTFNVVRIDYYAEFPPMVQPTDETVLTDIASDLLIYGALSYGCDHFNDKRGDKFESRYDQILSDIEGMGDEDETSGSAAVQPAYFYSDDLDGTL